MTHETILQKAIEKAVKNGFSPLGNPDEDKAWYDFFFKYQVLNEPIFDKDFARAFCKYLLNLDEDKKEELIGNLWQPYYDSWLEDERHQPNYEERLNCLTKDFLINLVLESDPISYLEKFL